MSLEAVAGKNPAAHVGKIYNVLATDIARAVCEQVDGIEAASVQLVSQIGRPIDAPWAAAVQVCSNGALDATLESGVKAVIASRLGNVAEMSRRIELDGAYPT